MGESKGTGGKETAEKNVTSRPFSPFEFHSPPPQYSAFNVYEKGDQNEWILPQMNDAHLTKDCKRTYPLTEKDHE